MKAGQNARKSRLAAARFADHRQNLAGPDVESDVMENMLFAIDGSEEGPACIGGIGPPNGHDRLRSGARIAVRDGALARRPGFHGTEQSPGVVLPGAGENVGGASFLDDVTLVHHENPVGHLGDHGEVMADVDRGGAEFPDNVLDGLEHLDLGGDIECRRRFVEHEQFRPARKCHGHHDPLLLAARCLVRIAPGDQVRLRNIEEVEKFDRTSRRIGALRNAVKVEALCDLVADRDGRVERSLRTLCDIGYVPASQNPLFGDRHGKDIAILEKDAAVPEPGARPCVTQRRKGNRRLSGSRFADERHDLAWMNLRTAAMDRLDPDARWRPALDDKVLDSQKRRHPVSSSK